ncbi:MAG: hypothetical protein M3021_09635 [Actinomycetota bacterium]|nr:hypothetical protein [Actinomycetota bacterium]
MQGDQVLNLNGRPVKLSERHTEILTVLALNPAGLPADELAAMVYPQGTPVTTVRAELVPHRGQPGVNNGHPALALNKVKIDVRVRYPAGVRQH